MNTLSVIDPQYNEVFFDAKSIGLAIVNSVLSSNVHDLLKRTLKNPCVILEQASGKRSYVFLTKDLDIHAVNVVFKDSNWYAEGLNAEMRREDLVELNNISKVIYKKLG
ncbi:hypothetical protein Palpr_1578 [Paludibacter propionicigenes WB4]|uniref:Uncharacterized protein n=1 Tax=Paludibacter propionicigenes (strain DSM 17365 / JCM 13257 / WB4) TaxID=694427 RepID=E4T4S9_PALPW|nr:hypothetical protein [Paludibacter propionicigenes]ADQ79723.1 hypothetical protein Palpr_1578 [Paludibacter propionicigenes WB4]